MENTKVLVKVDRTLAKRLLVLAKKGAFGDPVTSCSFNLHTIVNRLIFKAIIAGGKTLVKKQKGMDHLVGQKASLKAVRETPTLRLIKK
jgi:hypothetical protein